ncbi:hypothetical protein JE939_002842 [Yersinia ruckeri]|nr:hypothetical protein [Yersinia ruckeri]
MYHSNGIIRQLQAAKILAQKLDEAVAGVRDEVRDQVGKIGGGATRLLYYTSCFTENYQDVCVAQQLEDLRFRNGIYRLIKNKNIVFEMVKIYIELLLNHKTSQQLEYIKHLLMRANVHIAASTLTNQGFALGITMTVCVGMNVRVPIGRGIGNIAGATAGGLSVYGIIQNAADSARRLQIMHPAYYQALYMQELEMMYFLIEPTFMRSGALKSHWLSENDIADIITSMVRQ